LRSTGTGRRQFMYWLLQSTSKFKVHHDFIWRKQRFKFLITKKCFVRASSSIFLLLLPNFSSNWGHLRRHNLWSTIIILQLVSWWRLIERYYLKSIKMIVENLTLLLQFSSFKASGWIRYIIYQKVNTFIKIFKN